MQIIWVKIDYFMKVVVCGFFAVGHIIGVIIGVRLIVNHAIKN